MKVLHVCSLAAYFEQASREFKTCLCFLFKVLYFSNLRLPMDLRESWTTFDRSWHLGLCHKLGPGLQQLVQVTSTILAVPAHSTESEKTFTSHSCSHTCIIYIFIYMQHSREFMKSLHFLYHLYQYTGHHNYTLDPRRPDLPP